LPAKVDLDLSLAFAEHVLEPRCVSTDLIDSFCSTPSRSCNALTAVKMPTEIEAYICVTGML
jgi:hypothetical protein